MEKSQKNSGTSRKDNCIHCRCNHQCSPGNIFWSQTKTRGFKVPPWYPHGESVDLCGILLHNEAEAEEPVNNLGSEMPFE